LQIIIADARLARSRSIDIGGLHLLSLALGVVLALSLLIAAAYHWFFLQGVREGWPMVGTVVRELAQDQAQQRERFMRANIDAMARKLGEMQARVMQLESLGTRVMGLAGLPAPQTSQPPGQGGALVASRALSMAELDAALSDLANITERNSEWMTAAESRLFDQRIRKFMIPTHKPIGSSVAGSGFGWRIDPFTGRSALHTGTDFPAPQGTAILAAAGGVVVTQELHREYGNMIEIDHGNHIITRYAHASKTLVKRGDLVRPGQKIAEVGTTGRSTGPHLHFEVWVQGVVQNPQKFLMAGSDLPAGLGSAARQTPAAVAQR